MRKVLICMTEEADECLTANAELSGMTKSRLVRAALEEYYAGRKGFKLPTIPEPSDTIQPIDYTEEGV